MTHLGHPTTWTCAENLLTLRLRTSGVGLAMKRREFITLVGGAAASVPLAVRAQEAGRHYRIAILGPPRWQSFLDELGQAGFVKGRNLEIDDRGIGVAVASYE